MLTAFTARPGNGAYNNPRDRLDDEVAHHQLVDRGLCARAERAHSYWTASTMPLRAAERAEEAGEDTYEEAWESSAARAGSLG